MAKTVPGTFKWDKTESNPKYESDFVDIGCKLVMQHDCNLVVYSKNTGEAIWNTMTSWKQTGLKDEGRGCTLVM